MPSKQRNTKDPIVGIFGIDQQSPSDRRREKRMRRLLRGYVDNCGREDCNGTAWCIDIPFGQTMQSVAFKGDVGPLIHDTWWDDVGVTFVPLPPSPTWHDLYIACDYAIHASGDLFHTFIEGFTLEHGCVVVSLGS